MERIPLEDLHLADKSLKLFPRKETKVCNCQHFVKQKV